MFNSVIPSYNPADINSESGQLDFVLEKLLGKIEKIAPVEIVSYDRQTNRAEVQILNQSITSEGGKITRKIIKDIPAAILYGGGFLLSFPIKKGDIGWICAADRNISIFKQTLKLFAPATYEKHRYKDGFFIPNLINGFTYSAEDEDALLLTSTSGQTKISIKNDQINIIANTVNLGGTDGAYVLTENSTITDSQGGTCSIVSNTTKTKAV